MNRSLNHKLARHQIGLLSRQTNGRRARRSDPLADVCRAVNNYLRHAKKMAKEYPHLCGPYARKYFEDTVRMDREQRELDAALDKIYGRDTATVSLSTIWQDRYVNDPQNEKLFRKWFRETYG